MAELQIDRFYETCLRKQATEAWLVAGQPPLLRVEGQLRALQLPPLSTAEVESALHSLASPVHWDYYKQNGYVDFGSRYGDDSLVFHVTLLNHAGHCLGLFRIISKEEVSAAVGAKPFISRAKANP